VGDNDGSARAHRGHERASACGDRTTGHATWLVSISSPVLELVVKAHVVHPLEDLEGVGCDGFAAVTANAERRGQLFECSIDCAIQVVRCAHVCCSLAIQIGFDGGLGTVNTHPNRRWEWVLVTGTRKQEVMHRRAAEEVLTPTMSGNHQCAGIDERRRNSYRSAKEVQSVAPRGPRFDRMAILTHA